MARGFFSHAGTRRRHFDLAFSRIYYSCKDSWHHQWEVLCRYSRSKMTKSASMERIYLKLFLASANNIYFFVH